MSENHANTLGEERRMVSSTFEREEQKDRHFRGVSPRRPETESLVPTCPRVRHTLGVEGRVFLGTYVKVSVGSGDLLTGRLHHHHARSPTDGSPVS